MYTGHSSIDEAEVLYQAVGSIGLFTGKMGVLYEQRVGQTKPLTKSSEKMGVSPFKWVREM
jgi:hypothetical protein